MIGALASDDVRWQEARNLLVDGHAVDIGGRTVRFYPSYREVARRLGRAPSTVTRWAERNQISAARDERLAADRIEVRPTLPVSLASIVEEVIGMVRTHSAATRRAPSLRQVATVLRLIGTVTGAMEASGSLVRELELLREALLRRAGRRR